MALHTKHKNVSFSVGDQVRVEYRIVEKIKKAGKTKKSITEEVKERIQPFDGTVISIKGSGENTTFTVRKIGADAVGVERIFPLYSPWVDKILVKEAIPSKRAKLYHLRKKN